VQTGAARVPREPERVLSDLYISSTSDWCTVQAGSTRCRLQMVRKAITPSERPNSTAAATEKRSRGAVAHAPSVASGNVATRAASCPLTVTLASRVVVQIQIPLSGRELILDIIVDSTLRVMLHLNLKLDLSNLQRWQALSSGIVGSTDLACRVTLRMTPRW
jgi:hypothetical protein